MNVVLYRVQVWVAQRWKAITALVVSALTGWATQRGFDLTDAQVTAIVSVLTALGVYLAPKNKPQG